MAGKVIFLSRLCGGEGGMSLSIAMTDFLSRLCGGEGTIKRFRVARELSKPPMWR